RTAKLKTLAMATPFEQFINDRLIQYLAGEKIEIANDTALGIKRNVEIRRLPIPVEYTVARKTYLAAATKPSGIYLPCGGRGSIHNIELLENYRDCNDFNGLVPVNRRQTASNDTNWRLG